MEHEGFSFTTLRTSLQVLLNRKRIAENGNLQPDVVPMVRIPPNARERNQWVIKQALDTGVYGRQMEVVIGDGTTRRFGPGDASENRYEIPASHPQPLDPTLGRDYGSPDRLLKGWTNGDFPPTEPVCRPSAKGGYGAL
jgi:hypothetical protein